MYLCTVVHNVQTTKIKLCFHLWEDDVIADKCGLWRHRSTWDYGQKVTGPLRARLVIKTWMKNKMFWKRKCFFVELISMTLQFIFTFCPSSKLSHHNILRKISKTNAQKEVQSRLWVKGSFKLHFVRHLKYLPNCQISTKWFK